MVRWVGGLAEEYSGGGVMVYEVDSSGSVWGGGVDSRRRLRGGGLILSKEDIFRREMQSGRMGMIYKGFWFDCSFCALDSWPSIMHSPFYTASWVFACPSHLNAIHSIPIHVA